MIQLTTDEWILAHLKNETSVGVLLRNLNANTKAMTDLPEAEQRILNRLNAMMVRQHNQMVGRVEPI